MSAVFRAHQFETGLVRLRVGRFFENSNNVVSASRRYQIGSTAPRYIVYGSGVIAGQGANALPRRTIVRCRYSLRVLRQVLLPDFDGLIVAAAGESLSGLVEADAPHGGLVRL